jgi:hypothetical protein
VRILKDLAPEDLSPEHADQERVLRPVWWGTWTTLGTLNRDYRFGHLSLPVRERAMVGFFVGVELRGSAAEFDPRDDASQRRENLPAAEAGIVSHRLIF